MGEDDMGEACGRLGKEKKCTEDVAGGNRPFGRPKRRYEDNTKMYLKENRVGYCGMHPPICSV
jgi:hypothetical protein